MPAKDSSGNKALIREAELARETTETSISLKLRLDEPGTARIESPLPFLNHMLSVLACHGWMRLEVTASGDIDVDPHHLIEDCGIVLGKALRSALGDFSRIARCGFFIFPMDGSLAQAVVDLCGRPNLVWKADTGSAPIGGVDPRLWRDFFKGLVDALMATIHVTLHYRDGDHHAVEAIFKAFARALYAATRPLAPATVLSSKGKIGD
jgi:imidazoleglycerol-phosphate dehydratase